MGYLSCKAGSAIAVASSAPDDLRRFAHRDLEEATGGFSDDNLLGRGSHGSVYKAVIGGRRVAVKRPSRRREMSRELESEIQILSRLRSPRFVNLIGYSAEGGGLLVVEYMGKGTLYEMLHSGARPLMSWGKRIKVALQIAEAIQLLHSQKPPVIHRDIKSENVLMDKKGNAKLGDFGLAIRWRGEKGIPPAGTIGYLDPEYVTGDRVSTKTDVFSYGILLLEIISGRKAIDVGYSPSFIVDWGVPLIKKGKIGGVYDPRIGPPGNVSVSNQLGLVAAKCVRRSRERRPGMEEVVGWLTNLKKSARESRSVNPCMMVETLGIPLPNPNNANTHT